MIALAPQAAQAAPQVFEAHADGSVVVPADVNTALVEIHGAAGGAGGQTGGSPGRGSVQKLQLPVTPGQTLSYGVGQKGTNGALNAPNPAGVGGPTGGPGKGGNGGNGLNAGFGAYGAAGGGGGGATTLFVNGNLVAVAGGGGGGGGTNVQTTPGGDGGNADDDGQPGSDFPNASGGQDGDAGGPNGGNGENAVVIGGGGAGGGGGGYTGGSGGAFTGAIILASSGGGGGGGTSYVDSAKALDLGKTATETGNGFLTIQYADITATSVAFTNTPYDVVNRQSFGYTLKVFAAPGKTVIGTVHLTAESQDGPDAGTVYDLGTKAVDANGNVKIFSDKLKAGDYILTGAYTPTGASVLDNQPSEATQDLTVAKGDTTTSIGITEVDPTNFGEPVHVNVAVVRQAPAGGQPTGQVRFELNGAPFEHPVTLDGTGHASFVTTRLPVGSSNELRAFYLGDDEFNESDTNADHAVNVPVNQGDTSIGLTVDHDTLTSGEKSIFTATVTSNLATTTKPSGSVTFYDYDQPIGTVALDQNSGVAKLALEQFITSPDGHHHVSAVYNGDDNFHGATSAFVDVFVKFGSLKVQLSSTDNPTVVGNPTTFKIDLLPNQPTTAPVTGKIQLIVNGSEFGAPFDIDTNHAELTTSDLPVGSLEVYAKYIPDAASVYDANASNVLTQVVKKQGVDVLLTASATSLQYGQNLTLTAEVTPGVVGPATGTVTFYDHGAQIGLPVKVDANGKASISSASASKGVHQYVAVYSGDDKTIDGTSNTVQVTVAANLLKIRLATSLLPGYEGQDPILHAKLNEVGASTGLISGVIQYYSDGKKIGAPVPVSGTKAGTRILRGLKPGHHRIVGKFLPKTGSPFDIVVSDTLIQTIRKGKPNAKITMSVKRTSPSTGSVRFHVTYKGKAAKGQVRIWVDGFSYKRVNLHNGRGTVALTGLDPSRIELITVGYLGHGKAKSKSREQGLRRY